MTAIVLLIGARASEGDPLPLAIVVKVPVDELATVIRVQPQEGEG
jgi:hypothetical protein